MRNLLHALLVIFVITSGCKDGGGNPVTTVQTSSLPALSLKTDFARWTYRWYKLAKVDKNTIDLSKKSKTEEEETFERIATIFFRDFERRVIGGEPYFSSVTTGVINRYRESHDLVMRMDEGLLTQNEIVQILLDMDAMETYWEEQYQRTSPPKNCFPQPWELKEAQRRYAISGSATAAAYLEMSVREALASLPANHYESIPLMRTKWLDSGIAGIYYPSGEKHPLTGKVERGIIALSTSLVGRPAYAQETAVHEVGHGVDDLVLSRKDFFFDPSDVYYSISWEEINLGREWMRRSDEKNEFLTRYSETNPYEDFADHYRGFVYMSNLFREKIREEWKELQDGKNRQETPLFQKYHFMWLLFGRETGDTLDPEITAELHQMPQDLIALYLSAMRTVAPAMRMLSAEGKENESRVCCTGFTTNEERTQR